MQPPEPDEDEQECEHLHVTKEDDGLDAKWFECQDCCVEVRLTEPDEDGHSEWEVV